PYLLLDRPRFLGEVLSYSGIADFGWLAAIRWGAAQKGRALEAAWTLLPATKVLFLAAYALALFFALRRDPARGLLLAPLLFYALYGGVAAQYLVWVVPLALFLGERLLAPFTAAATAALVAFYWTAHPGILFGSAAVPVPRLVAASLPV